MVQDRVLRDSAGTGNTVGAGMRRPPSWSRPWSSATSRLPGIHGSRRASRPVCRRPLSRICHRRSCGRRHRSGKTRHRPRHGGRS
jgi:hypothetical protein